MLMVDIEHYPFDDVKHEMDLEARRLWNEGVVIMRIFAQSWVERYFEYELSKTITKYLKAAQMRYGVCDCYRRFIHLLSAFLLEIVC